MLHHHDYVQSGQVEKISVLLPSYNRADLIGDSIRSILAQTRTPEQIIVIDDGSTDDTQAVVRAFGDRIVYVRKENGGKAAAVNLGMSMVTGDAVLVTDDDDLLPPTALEHHAAALNAHPEADFSYGRFSRFRGDPATAPDSDDIEAVPVNDPRRLVVKLLERCFLVHPTWMARTDAVRRAGLYREDLKRGQDFDMILRLARANEGVFVDEVVLWQRHHFAMRGPSDERVFTDLTFKLWAKYNRKMLSQLDQSWGDEDFRTYPAARRPDIDEARAAVLQRARLLLRHGLYRNAFAHLDRYAAMSGAPRAVAHGPLAVSFLLEGDSSAPKPLPALSPLIDATPPSWAHRARFMQWVARHTLRELRDRRFGDVMALMRFTANSFVPPRLGCGAARNGKITH